jgi:hypothetical protein
VVIRDSERAGRFVSMARAYRRGQVARAAAAGVSVSSVAGAPLRSVRLPWIGTADLWVVDGLAVLRVASGAVLVVPWFTFRRFERRRGG